MKLGFPFRRRTAPKNLSGPLVKSASTTTFLLFIELCVLLIVLGILVRVINVSFPATKVFDEVYFPVFAIDYLHRVSFFDVHPPLGKFIIAIGIKLFGDTSFGWRIIPLLFGILNIGLFAWLWKVWRKENIGAWLVAAMVAIDGIFIVYSRTGLMDGILVFFILLTVLLAYKVNRFRTFIVFGILLGATISIKWVGLGALAPVFYILWRRKKLAYIPIVLFTAAVIYLLINYTGQLIIHANNPLLTSLKWNQEAWGYHFNLKEGHPWGSAWWTWPLLKRPVLFFYEQDVKGNIRTITTLANPLLWWGSMAAVATSTIHLLWLRLRAKKSVVDHPLVPMIIAFFAFWLPWAGVHRVVFLYHFIPSYAFALLILCYWLSLLWKILPKQLIVLLILIGIVGVFFIPFAAGLPLTESWLGKHIWVSSWLY